MYMKIYEGDIFDKVYEVFSTLKKKKLKMNKILIGKFENLLEYLDFEQDYWSRTAIGKYKIGHDSIRLLKWLAY